MSRHDSSTSRPRTNAPHFRTVLQERLSRRDMLKGGVAAVAASAIAPVAKIHDVRLTIGSNSGLHVLGYRVRFEQALLNLIDNAVKFNRPNGEVKVDTFKRNDRVEISVADTGIGIPDEDVSRVFERFYRVDKARSRQVGGTGLGLSIVRHAIEQMQGSVTVESKLGQGSCFRISLPVYDEVTASE